MYLLQNFVFVLKRNFYRDLKLFITCFVQVSYSTENGILFTTITNASTITFSGLNSNSEYCIKIAIAVTQNNMVVDGPLSQQMNVTTGKIEKFGLCFVCILFTLQFCLSCNVLFVI